MNLVQFGQPNKLVTGDLRALANFLEKIFLDYVFKGKQLKFYKRN